MRLNPLFLFPAVALMAQAPAKVDLVQRYNAELPSINQLLKDLKTQEALTKVQGLVPGEPPAFNGATLQTIALSIEDVRGMSALYGLLAKTTAVSGQWEKAVEVQEKRVQGARAALADFEKAQAPISAQWKQVSEGARDYIAKNTSRQQELQTSQKALKEDVDAVNAKKKKLDAKGVEELKARIAKAPQDEQELDQINAALPVHKNNLINAPKVFKLLEDNRKELEGMIKTSTDAFEKSKKLVADQNDEITQFNTLEVIKKVKIVGRKNWVDAVLRAPANITKQGGPEEQTAFLNRLLVLDPGNAAAQKALDNLVAGKEAFAKAPKTTKKGSTKKK